MVLDIISIILIYISNILTVGHHILIVPEKASPRSGSFGCLRKPEHRRTKIRESPLPGASQLSLTVADAELSALAW
jgi:hypothetical protein